MLQHADNPVDWYPWGEEAFRKAREEDKPIFLSIGYSTCHWCHVMAHESFEDEEVAKLLNRYFVSIKVDKEERPDLDAVYMDACQYLTGSGGWPLTHLHIDTIDVRPFLPIQLDGNEITIQLLRHLFIFKGFMGHHVAPMASRISDT